MYKPSAIFTADVPYNTRCINAYVPRFVLEIFFKFIAQT